MAYCDAGYALRERPYVITVVNHLLLIHGGMKPSELFSLTHSMDAFV